MELNEHPWRDGWTDRRMDDERTDGQVDGWARVWVEALRGLEDTGATLLKNPLKETFQSSWDKVSIAFLDYFSIKPM